MCGCGQSISVLQIYMLLASIPGRTEDGPGIDCLRMRHLLSCVEVTTAGINDWLICAVWSVVDLHANFAAGSFQRSKSHGTYSLGPMRFSPMLSSSGPAVADTVLVWSQTRGGTTSACHPHTHILHYIEL